MSGDYALRRDGDRWLVLIHGVEAAEVYKARHRSDRYPFGDASVKGRGRTRWHASNVADEDFDTRREAVAGSVRRILRECRSPDCICGERWCWDTTDNASSPYPGDPR